MALSTVQNILKLWETLTSQGRQAVLTILQEDADVVRESHPLTPVEVEKTISILEHFRDSYVVRTIRPMERPTINKTEILNFIIEGVKKGKKEYDLAVFVSHSFSTQTNSKVIMRKALNDLVEMFGKYKSFQFTDLPVEVRVTRGCTITIISL